MLIFDIKRYAINDGPGIRTTIFVKGCPLRCVWCHNPESWLSQPELLFKRQKCIGCNTCGLYPDRLGLPMEALLRHYTCEELAVKAETCPAMAIEMAGKDYTVDELMAEVEKERDVMSDSGGGVTISGGEPLVQHEELLALLRACGERGLHRTVDTTLYATPEIVERVSEQTDLFLVDLKVMDDAAHRRLTGVSNQRILANMKSLCNNGVPFWLRIPLIEGVNADEANIEATARFVSEELSIRGEEALPPVSLLPYHEMGRDKHARRGTTYNPDGMAMSAPADVTIERCIRQFAQFGIKAKAGG